MNAKPPILIRKLPSLPPRPERGHKGLFGRLLVVGGCDHMLGAPVLAATAALRCGAGLVQIAVPRSILVAALSITPELIGLPLSDKPDIDALLAAAESADALVIGPGMSQSPVARQRLMALLKLDKPAVLDADALNMLASGRIWPKSMRLRAVLTPHPGEMRRLARLLPLPPGEGWGEGSRSAGPASSLASDSRPCAPQEGQRRRWPCLDEQASRQALAQSAATTFAQTVVLKGHETIIADGDRIYVNHTGDSTLSKAGSGDVLAGIIGCFIAQQMDPFDAACLAAHIHGLCGQLAGRALTRRCPLARDLIAQLPAVFRRLES